jgi:hypothetical protein
MSGTGVERVFLVGALARAASAISRTALPLGERDQATTATRICSSASSSVRGK